MQPEVVASTPEVPGRLRPRSHILGDEAVNHISGLAIRARCAVQQLHPDYGLDLLVTTVDEHGVIENGWIYVQSRGTEELVRRADGRIRLRLEAAHAAYYLGEAYPIILVGYESAHHRAFWIHTQPYLQGLNVDLSGRKYVTVVIEPGNLLNEAAFEQIRQLKNAVHTQVIDAGIAHG
jgi:hypothetical protein